MDKIKIGVYSLTCCEGCTIVLVEALNKKFNEWTQKIDFVDMRVLKPFTGIHETDIALVEGAVSTPAEVQKIKEIRKKTKKLISYGAGATIGFPSDQRNRFSPEKLKAIAPLIKKFKQLDKVHPIKDFVKVDDVINGCPVNEADVIQKIEELLAGGGR